MVGSRGRTGFRCLARFAAVAFAMVMLVGLATEAAADDRPEWKVGYWAWRTSYRPLDPKTAGRKPVELLYVEAGEYRNDDLWLDLPERLPPADAYRAVVRFNEARCPDPQRGEAIARAYLALKQTEHRRGRRLTGLQLDYDCPTRRLGDYARFLKALRAALPKEELLSITALLDWFAPGSGVAEVIRQVDEFVPQFYDVAPGRLPREETGVAHPVDPAWGKTFNSFGRPYRIGIASFGRIVGISRGKGASACGSPRARIIDDSPLALVARVPLRPVAVRRSTAGERIVTFGPRSRRAPSPCDPVGDEVKLAIPTAGSVSSAYAAARGMGGWCRGVVFFRWPLEDEAMALSQPEVAAIIAGKREETTATPTVDAADGECAAVSCADLYLRPGERFATQEATFRVRSSRDLEYFLPDPLLRARLSGPRTIEVIIPAYAGVPRIRLGRAVALEPPRFTLEEVPK